MLSKAALKHIVQLFSFAAPHGHHPATLFFPWQCTDFCHSGGCEGYFLTREGGCSKCPGGANVCDDLTGNIRECNNGGLVGGECRSCKDEHCINCDGKSGPGVACAMASKLPPTLD